MIDGKASTHTRSATRSTALSAEGKRMQRSHTERQNQSRASCPSLISQPRVGRKMCAEQSRVGLTGAARLRPRCRWPATSWRELHAGAARAQRIQLTVIDSLACGMGLLNSTTRGLICDAKINSADSRASARRIALPCGAESRRVIIRVTVSTKEQPLRQRALPPIPCSEKNRPSRAPRERVPRARRRRRTGGQPARAARRAVSLAG